MGRTFGAFHAIERVSSVYRETMASGGGGSADTFCAPNKIRLYLSSLSYLFVVSPRLFFILLPFDAKQIALAFSRQLR